MSSNMKILSYFVIIQIYFVLESSGTQLLLGGIFHEDNYEAKMAFRYAINRINMRSNMEKTDLEFIPVMRTVSRTDSYKTGQLACDMAEKGVSAILGPSSVASSGIVESICRTLEIPHVQNTWNPVGGPYHAVPILNVHPDPRSLAKSLANLLHHMHWKSFTILYEDDEGLIRLQEVLKASARGDLPITVRQLGDGPDYRPLLKEIQASQESNIILDCALDHVIPILSQAKDVNLMEDYQSYILTSLDSHTLQFGDLVAKRPNITTLRLVDPNSHELQTAINDWEMGELRYNRRITIRPESVKVETALMHDAVNLLAESIKDLNKVDRIYKQNLSCDQPVAWEHGLGIVEYMKVKQMSNGLTGPIKFDEVGKRTDFTLQIVELAKDGFKVTGTWSLGTGIHFTRTVTELYTQIVENLQNKVFVVSSRIGAPYLLNRVAKEGEVLEGNARYEGYSMDLIDGISKILNFTYRFELTPDGRYGSFNKISKQWDGLVRQLLERKADLAICDLTITYERRTAVDFTMPFMTLGISILYSKTQKEPPDLFSFTSPLSADVWLYMATAFLGVSFLLYVLARMSPDDWENPHPCNEDPEELENAWDLKNCLWLTLGSIMAQGCDILPKGISTRMVSGMWWFFSLILLSSYTANLAAFLTMERMGPTIESAEDLAKQSKIKYGAVSGGSTLAFFKESNFSTYQRMWAAMESARPSVFTKSNQEGVDRVQKGKGGYAFLMESTSIEYEVERNCDLTQVGGLLDSKGYGIAMPVNSPYRTAISGAVLKMQEDGQLHILKEKWWKKMYGGGSCDDDTKAKESAAELDLDNVGGVFVVLFGGVCIAFIIAILEFLWNVRKIAVDEQLTLSEALIIELKFVLNIFVTKKAARPNKSESSANGSQNGSETRSIAQNMLRTAGSFLHIDMFNEPKKSPS